MEKEAMPIRHPFPPLYDRDSQILILGSFPSVKSREQMFFYGHKQNRFWKVMAAVLGCDVPESIEEKKKMLHANHIALWDVIASCRIYGSSDSSIKDVIPNDLSPILQNAKIEAIYCNGAASHKLYEQYLYPMYRIHAVKLPSTSPANAAFTLDKLITKWTEKIKGKEQCAK